jgi:hypothetical protein
MSDTVRRLTSVRVQDSDAWNALIAGEVRGLLARLGAEGWTLYDIAAWLGCSRGSLYSWRIGGAEMPASKLLALRDLVARNVRRSA